MKKNRSNEELLNEVELLQEQVVNLNARCNAFKRELANHPAKIELDKLKSKWWVRLFYKG